MNADKGAEFSQMNNPVGFGGFSQGFTGGDIQQQPAVGQMP